jgi:hypothetical protein
MQTGDRVMMKDNNIFRDGSNGELRLTGCPELVHREDVERKPKPPGQYGSDGHASARKSKQKRIRPPIVPGEVSGKEFARVLAIPEHAPLDAGNGQASGVPVINSACSVMSSRKLISIRIETTLHRSAVVVW